MTEELFALPGCRTNYPGQGEVYVARPDTLAAPFPVLAALHGSGRQATSYREVPFYTFQRDRAVENGYLFVCLSNGMDTWGLDDGLRNLEILYDHLLARDHVAPRWVLWATSAGGALMHRFVHRQGDRVRGALGTFSVYDLLDAYDHSPGCAKAWGVGSRAELRSATEGRNPPDLVSGLTSTEYLILHGREDQLLLPDRHALRFRDEANARGGHVRLILTDGGHSTENWALCDGVAIDASLQAWRSA